MRKERKIKKPVIEQPSSLKSFVGETIEEAADYVVSTFPDNKLRHEHNGEICYNMACNLNFWHDKEVKSVFGGGFARFKDFVGKDPEKLNSIILLKVRKHQKKELMKARLKKVIQLITSSAAGAMLIFLGSKLIGG